MALTLLQLRDDIRGTEFMYRGAPTDLRGATGERIMSNTRLNLIINEAGREVQALLKDKREIRHNHCMLGSDAVPLPSDMLVLDQVILYDDENETLEEGTATGATSATVLVDSAQTNFLTTLAVGHRVDNITDGSSGTILTVDSNTQVTLSASLTGGADNTFQSGDEYAIYDPEAETEYYITEGTKLPGPVLAFDSLKTNRTEDTGKPETFSIKEQDGTQFILWDVPCDARYFFDVFYYPSIEDFTDDGDTTTVRQIYQSLFFAKACEKVALRLGDDRGIERFAIQYERLQAGLKGAVTSARSVPMTRFARVA